MKPHKRQAAGSPEEWLVHATSDLRIARVARRDREILLEQVCFHAQQACEKSLKAVLMFKGLGFPLVHDLEVLLEIAEEGGLKLPRAVQQADILSPYAVEARYPGGEEEVTSADADRAIRVAQAVVAWASTIIKGGADATHG